MKRRKQGVLACICAVFGVVALLIVSVSITSGANDVGTSRSAIETSSNECKHGKIFSFQSKDSTAMSYIKPWCKSGTCYHLGYSLFRGTPTDLSYLDVIGQYSDSDNILCGEYYTITATVTHADYDFQRTRISCEVRSDDIIVCFSVEFRGEFEEEVSLLTEGDEVTFRGRFYDEGCGFTDSELIGKR